MSGQAAPYSEGVRLCTTWSHNRPGGIWVCTECCELLVAIYYDGELAAFSCGCLRTDRPALALPDTWRPLPLRLLWSRA